LTTTLNPLFLREASSGGPTEANPYYYIRDYLGDTRPPEQGAIRNSGVRSPQETEETELLHPVGCGLKKYFISFIIKTIFTTELRRQHERGISFGDEQGAKNT
jgi:hypothetical protein